MFCEFCNGVLGLLGVLGDLAWFRCQDCGIDQYLPAADLPQDDEDEDEF